MRSRLPLDELKERIELFLLERSHPLLSEPGHDVVDLSATSYSLSTQYDKLLWHVWNENTNLVRQITGIVTDKPGRLELRYQRFGKGPGGTLLLTESRASSDQLHRRTQRTLYLQSLRRWLQQLFPQWKVQELTTEPDLARSFSGRYARGWIARGKRAWAVIGSGASEDSVRSDDILAYGLLWLDWLREKHASHVVEGLRVFLPRGTAETTCNRMAWLNPQAAKWELIETGSGAGEELQQRDPADFGNLKTSLPRWVKPAQHSNVLEDLAAEISSSLPMLEVRYSPDGVRSWSLRGLLLARETPNGIVFGLGRAETPLQQQGLKEFHAWVRRISEFRRPDAADANHPLYRIQPERWMESQVGRCLDQVEPGLAAGMVYEQVPAVSGAARGLLDLLSVNAEGRLAVLELKAAEDLQLPLQALDYWMRVHWHNQRGELERAGYFPGRELNRRPPLLLLVSPALQFHSACEAILRYLSPEIEVLRVGLNQDWRRELKVVFREANSPRRAARG